MLGRALLVVALVAGSVGDALAQTTVVGAALKNRANALLTLMGFGLTPDVTTGSLSIANASSGDPGIQSTSLGGGFTLSPTLPVYLEGTAAYSRYDPRFLVSDGTDSRELPTKWNSASVTVGVGWDFPLMPDLKLRPIVNGTYGRVTSDAGIAGRLLANQRNVELDFLANGRMEAAGFGGSLMLDYERYRPESEIDIELRYTSIMLRTINANSEAVEGTSLARSLNLWSRYRAPTGFTVMDRPLRYVVEYVFTRFYGDLDGALGFSYLNSIGAGLELDASKYGRIVSRWRLVVRHKFGPNISGTSVGLAMSF